MLSAMIGKAVEVKISGNRLLVGILVDCGLDIIVLFDGTNYVYIPFGHIQTITLADTVNMLETLYSYDRSGSGTGHEISYRKILLESKGMFVQIYVGGNQSIHGYVTSIMTDYFVFYSPVHQTLFVPMFHLKWLIPYPENQTPYTLGRGELPVHPSSVKLARTFEEQIKRMENTIVMFDLGSEAEKIGLLKRSQDHLVELITAAQQPVYWSIQHIKVVSSPNL